MSVLEVGKLAVPQLRIFLEVRTLDPSVSLSYGIRRSMHCALLCCSVISVVLCCIVMCRCTLQSTCSVTR